MADIIDRQAAIEAIEEMQIPIMRSEFSDEQLIFTGMSEALAAIKGLPSAQPDVTDKNVGDLISRQAAIDAVEKYDFNFPEYMERFVTELRDAMKEDLKGDIADLPSAQPEQQWIPCSERLPKKADGKYWICTDTKYQCQCRWTDNVYGLGSSGEWSWKIFDIPQYSHVVAWMPLPDPWIGEDDDRA